MRQFMCDLGRIHFDPMGQHFSKTDVAETSWLFLVTIVFAISALNPKERNFSRFH
jgi:hypothetical protein